MEIIKVKEPEYSSRQLEDFEKKYGFNSEFFYEHYRQGEILIEDEYQATEWAFEYEINRKAREMELKQDDKDFFKGGGQFLGSSSFCYNVI